MRGATGVALALAALTGTVVSSQAPVSAVVKVKVGAKCTKLNATSGTFVCVKKAGKLVWSRAVTTTTVKATNPAPAAGSSAGSAAASSAGSSAGSSTPPSTTAVSGGAAKPAETGIEGTWKATSKSEVGYRVKEVLVGQSTEGVGRTNAVSGTMTIAGTKVTAVEVEVDTTQLTSDSDRRDRQVHTRILDTAKFPTATLKLASAIDFGKAPGDRVEIKAKAAGALTVRGVTKNVSFDVVARRNGAAIEVNGEIPFLMADFRIPDPSVADLVKTDQNGLIEFLVVFER